MGMVKPDAGELYLETWERLDLTKKAPEEIVNLGVFLGPGGRRLFPALTVKENLLMGAYWREARRKLEENVHLCFQNFLPLEERRNQMGGTLSGVSSRC